MTRRKVDLDPELEAFLAFRKIERHAPADLRARVLAQARAYLGEDAPQPARLPAPPPPPLARGRRVARIALAASFAIAGIAVGAVAARHGRSADSSPAPSPDHLSRAPGLAVGGVHSAASEPPTSPVERGPAHAPHATRHLAKGDPFTAELELLQRAQVAYTRHDFSIALALIEVHARRFPSGQLAEQREALRVRSLAGAGRADEAHRAASAFAARFPRSVLLPRLAGGAESSQP
jgi:hypothetical protein